jgi:PIN domain nuclease of toxin-antitoxin system
VTPTRKPHTPPAAPGGYLLDTHALYYLDSDPESLIPPALLAELSDPSVGLFVSSLTPWEMSIKHHAGRWPEVAALLADYHATLLAYGCTELSFSGEAALQTGRLPPLHKDPFDRGLIAQALTHGLTLVSEDALIQAYAGVMPDLNLRWS